MAGTISNADHVVQRNEVLWDVPHVLPRDRPPDVAQPAEPLAPDLQTPATDEVTVGVDRELGENLAVSGTFAYRSTTDLQFLLPIGANASTWRFGGRATGTVQLNDGSTLAFDEPYFLLTLDPRRRRAAWR